MCTHTPRPQCGRVPPHEEPGPRTQTQKPTSWCGAVGRSDKSIWGKLSVRNFRSNCLGQNWLLGRANPAAWGWGTMGANVLMCGRWLGRDNGRISQSSGWLIWDGSSQPLTVGSPIVLLLIPTSHKLQTKVNLFLKGGGKYRTVFQMRKLTQKCLFARDGWLWLSLCIFFALLSSFILLVCSLDCPAVLLHSWVLNDVFPDSSGAGAPVGGLETALLWGSLILKYTEMPSLAGLKSVWCRPWVPSLDRPLLSVARKEPSFLFLSSSFLFPSLKRRVNKLWQLSRGA